MSGRSHKFNSELLAQSKGNIASILFGGIAATGALARTAMNTNSGARAAIAGMFHAVTLLVIILAFTPFVSMVPLA